MADAAFPVLLLLVVVGGGVLAWWWHRQRMERKRAWAASVGWTVVGTDRSLVRRWHGTPFGVGDSRRVSELVVGRFDGRPAMSFAYRYTTGSGKERQTSTFHVIALGLPAYLPRLELTPGHALQRFAARLGAQDIELESAEFNDAWRVAARDERFAHAVLNPRVMERLLAPDARGMSMRIEGTDILCWSSGLPRYDRIGPRLRVMSSVVAGVPRFVWLDHGHDPTP